MENERNKENKTELSRRPAQSEDTEFARKAHHRAYHDVVMKQFGEWDEEKQNTFFESEWKDFKHEILTIDDQPCGYFSMEQAEDSINLHELVLLPEFQGQGIGNKILSEAIELANAQHVPIRLWVLKANKAVHLYSRKGFKQVRETETHFQMEYTPAE